MGVTPRGRRNASDTPVRSGRAKRALACKRGFSLLEMLIALAVLALGATVILTRTSGAIGQVTDHTVFFDFQRQVSDLRRTAFRAQAPLVVMPPPDGARASKGLQPAETPDEPRSLGVTSDGAEMVAVSLRGGWTYALSQPLRIAPSGQCQNVSADLVGEGRPRVHLITKDGACHFYRVVYTP